MMYLALSGRLQERLSLPDVIAGDDADALVETPVDRLFFRGDAPSGDRPPGP